MRRITSTTRALDLFGAGIDGFTDGSAPAPPPTHLNADFFNMVQEEIARAVEGNGASVVAAGGDANYFQLDDAIADAARIGAANSSARYVTEGLTFDTSGTSLSTTLAAGRMVFDGRRYVITSAKLTTGGFASWGPLTANRDHYFFIAPENPATPSTPPNRATVYVTRADVANGAAAPATPAGTMLFAMLVTDASDITAVTYFNRGPRLMAENGALVALRPSIGGSTAELHAGASGLVHLGYNTADSQEGYFGTARIQELRLRSSVSSLFTLCENYRYTFVAVTTAAGGHDETIITTADVTDGTMVMVTAEGVAFDPSDPTDAFAFRITAAAHRDGAVFDLDGSGSPAEFTNGAGAIAASVGVNFFIDGGTDLRLALTGHNTDTMRWFVEVHVMVGGN